MEDSSAEEGRSRPRPPPPPPPSVRPSPPPPPPPPSQPPPSPPPLSSTEDNSPAPRPTISGDAARPAAPKPPPKPIRKVDHEGVPIQVAIQHVIVGSGFDQGLESPVKTHDRVSPDLGVTEADAEIGTSGRNPFACSPAAESTPSPPSGFQYGRVSEAAPRSRLDAPRESSLGISMRASEARPPAPHPKQSASSLIGPGEPNNQIYHKNQFSEFWLSVFIVLLVLQFTLLLVVGFRPLPTGAFVLLLLLVLLCLGCVVYARWLVVKNRLAAGRNMRLKNNVLTPEDETDTVPDRAVYALALGSVLLGVSFAVFTAVLAGSDDIASGGFFTQETLLQVMRFASIVLLALHRTLRPSNRVDPMRTIMELEVVTVCWDAIDGSTLYELLDNSSSLSLPLQSAIRFLMAFWYFSVGIRMAVMLLTHLSPQSMGGRWVLTAPLQLAPQPTVDRTLQGLRLRSIVIMLMACADFYAAALRIYMWSKGQLDALQQDMAVKNVVFLITFSGAYSMYTNTISRQWNTREVTAYPCVVKYPARERQFFLLRHLFVASHLTLAALLTYVLMSIHDDNSWVVNLVLDVILCAVFYIYTRNIDRKADAHDPTVCLTPRKEFFAFPSRLGAGLGAALAASLFLARIPALYNGYSSLRSDDDGDGVGGGSSLFSYDNSMLLVVLMILPIGFYASYFTIGYMLFRKEFTASPGNYNSIHDPVINMVATFTMTEGALDVLSCATLMQLAANDLPTNVNNAIILFCLLEMVNACQSFALQCTLAGGHDDTPLDLVKWTAFMRTFRAVIDAGAIVLRVVLWVQYNAVSSVFLVKNLYNLIHTSTQIERYRGVKRYPKDTLFSEFVTPQDWYGMTKEEWRLATKDTLAAQARSGRRV